MGSSVRCWHDMYKLLLDRWPLMDSVPFVRPAFGWLCCHSFSFSSTPLIGWSRISTILWHECAWLWLVWEQVEGTDWVTQFPANVAALVSFLSLEQVRKSPVGWVHDWSAMCVIFILTASVIRTFSFCIPVPRRGGACDVQWMCVCIALGFFGLVDLC